MKCLDYNQSHLDNFPTHQIFILIFIHFGSRGSLARFFYCIIYPCENSAVHGDPCHTNVASREGIFSSG